MTIIILIFKQSNGTYCYAPKLAMMNPSIARAMRFSDEQGFPSVMEAMNAIRRDKSIPNDHDIEVERDDPEATLPNLDAMTYWPFPRGA